MATPKIMTREQILARKLGHGELNVDGFGTVKIRCLTIDEAALARDLTDKPAEQVKLIVSLGMTDPQLTLDEVREWATHESSGVLNGISEGIGLISGMTNESGKDAYKSA